MEPIDTSAFRVIERRRPTDAELTKYERFKLTASGISPISQPGMIGGNYLASGIEHNEVGRPTASGEMHGRMNEKRFKKFAPLKNRRDLFMMEGDPNAPIGLVYVDLPVLVKPYAKSGSNPIQPNEVLEQLRKLVVALQGNSSQHQPQ